MEQPRARKAVGPNILCIIIIFLKKEVPLIDEKKEERRGWE